MRVLVLDGNLRSALAVTRSLGAKGAVVLTADETRRTLAGSSRYCSESFSYPSPYSDSAGFLEKVGREIVERHVDVLFPASDVTTAVVLQNRDRLGSVRIPFAPFETYDLLTDKYRLLNLAASLGISTPETHMVNGKADIDTLPTALSFPVVVKPSRSRVFSKGRWIRGGVRYAGSLDDIRRLAATSESLAHPFLVQQYVEGTGCGLFTLYDRGKPVVFFSHRRLREKPASGGVSVLSESVAVPPRVLEAGRDLLDAVGWHGVAMVEFRVTPSGVPYLMEVNARFWGSLQLAVDAGVDFPGLLLQLAEGHSPDPVPEYRVGVRNRWLLGDAIRLSQLLLGRSAIATVTPDRKLQSVGEFLRFFDANTRYEVNRWDDIRPCLMELWQYVRRKKSVEAPSSSVGSFVGPSQTETTLRS